MPWIISAAATPSYPAGAGTQAACRPLRTRCDTMLDELIDTYRLTDGDGRIMGDAQVQSRALGHGDQVLFLGVDAQRILLVNHDQVPIMNKIADVSDMLGLCQDAFTGHRCIKATGYFARGSLIHQFHLGEYLDAPTYLSVQVDEDRHMQFSPEFLQYMNHSCDPNAYLDMASGEVVSIREIAVNEEVTWFYPSTEWSMIQPFDCFCRADGCLGRIQGAAHLDRYALARYKFSEHILRKLKAQPNQSRLTELRVGTTGIGNSNGHDRLWQPAQPR